MLHMEGYGGLRDGIGLTRGLLENFWDHLYPEIEEGDAELRVAPLDWMGSRLNRTFQLLPITKTGLNWFDYKQAHGVGHESDADTDTKRENYQKAIQEGKVTGEMWDDAFKATSKDYYKNAVQTLDSLLENIEALKTVCNEKFQDSGPSFSPLQAAVEEVRHTVKGLWMEKRKLDPDSGGLAGGRRGSAGRGGGRREADGRATGAQRRLGNGLGRRRNLGRPGVRVGFDDRPLRKYAGGAPHPYRRPAQREVRTPAIPEKNPDRAESASKAGKRTSRCRFWRNSRRRSTLENWRSGSRTM